MRLLILLILPCSRSRVSRQSAHSPLFPSAGLARQVRPSRPASARPFSIPKQNLVLTHGLLSFPVRYTKTSLIALIALVVVLIALIVSIDTVDEHMDSRVGIMPTEHPSPRQESVARGVHHPEKRVVWSGGRVHLPNMPAQPQETVQTDRRAI